MNCFYFSQESNIPSEELKNLTKQFFEWVENWTLIFNFKMDEFFLSFKSLELTLLSLFKKSYTMKCEKSENLLSIGFGDENNRNNIIIKISDEIINKLKEKTGNCKIITLAGKPGVGKSTMLNSLVYFSKFRHFDGCYPQIFQTSDSLFSETLGVNIFFTEIEVGDFERVLLIDTEGFGALRENDDIDQEIYNKILEKIYAILMLTSDCFILFLETRYEQSNLDFIKKIIDICKFIKRSETGNPYINEIDMEIFLFLRKMLKK